MSVGFRSPVHRLGCGGLGRATWSSATCPDQLSGVDACNKDGGGAGRCVGGGGWGDVATTPKSLSDRRGWTLGSSKDDGR